MRFASLLLGLVGITASAQDGGQLYTQYCSACHAPDGKGAAGGQFPPLADSAWLAGDPDRAIQIVLHGLEGPIEVNGRSYNLMMPPQGAVLSDDFIAAILSYCRTSWGNQGDRVEPATVEAIRRATAGRETPWTAPELLKLHPLPKPESALKNLTSRIYHGNFTDLPDFDQLEAKNIEEEHDGLISLSHADRKDNFGLVWEGDFEAPADGEYTFRLDADDGGRVAFGEVTVAKIDGTGPMNGSRVREGKIDLEAGPNPIRIEYYESQGQEGIELSWRGPGSKNWQSLSDAAQKKSAPEFPSIPIEPTTDRAAIYRNFIAGTTPRAIGIGLPGGINFAYSADHFAPELLWTGRFMDGGRHWTNRGQGNQRPAGDNILKVSNSPAFPDGTRFRGYELDPAGNPTFAVSLGDLDIQDSYQASDGNLIRTLTTTGRGEPVSLLLAEEIPIEAAGDGAWTIAGLIELTIEGATASLEDNRLRLHLTPGRTATLTYVHSGNR